MNRTHAKKTFGGILLITAAIYGAFLLGQVQGRAQVGDQVAKDNFEAGEIKACETALRGINTMAMAATGIGLAGHLQCRIEGNQVVFDQLYVDGSQATFTLDIIRLH